MTDTELLWKIVDKVDYINDRTTQLEADMIWVKWIVMGIAVIIVTQAIGIIYNKLRNNKK